MWLRTSLDGKTHTTLRIQEVSCEVLEGLMLPLYIVLACSRCEGDEGCAYEK